MQTQGGVEMGEHMRVQTREHDRRALAGSGDGGEVEGMAVGVWESEGAEEGDGVVEAVGCG